MSQIYCPTEHETIDREECGDCEMCPEEKSDGEIWDEIHEEERTKKESNLKNSIAILESKGIKYQKFSDYHYRIKNFDFWPSTGKFYNKISKKYGRGVFNLIYKLER